MQNVLLLPNMTTAERLALTNLKPGSIVFDTTLSQQFITNNGGVAPIWENVTQKTFKSTNKSVESASVAFGGTGYSFGDIVQPSGGTAIIPAKLIVAATGAAGAILAVQLIPSNADSGVYSVAPPLNSNPVITLTGSGSGALINLVMTNSGVVTIDPNNPGAIEMNTPHGYLQLPTIPPGQEQSVNMNEGGIRYQNNNNSVYLQSESGLEKILTDKDLTKTLLKENNLSDLPDFELSRINLGAQRFTIIGTVDPTAVSGRASDTYFNATTGGWFVCTVTGNPGTWRRTVSALTGALLSANNLSDVADATTSRVNLGAQRFTIIGTVAPTAVSGRESDSYFNSTTGEWFVCRTTGSPGVWQTISASQLGSPTNPVVVNTRTPVARDVLTATSATNATWQTPFSYSVISANRDLAPSIVVPVGSGVTVLVFTNAPINSNNALNLTNGIFTIPVGKSGVWKISYKIQSQSTGITGNNYYNLDAAIYRNGSFASFDYSSFRQRLTNNEIGGSNNTSEVYVNVVAGDQITVRYINNGQLSVTIAGVNFIAEWIST
jgi:hypothetical protein